jgi:hypothetical protein
MSLRVRDDALALDRDPITGRSSLSANTGSPLGRFLETLAETWDTPEIVAVNDVMPAMLFANPDAARQIEAELNTRLWPHLANLAKMPLTKPQVKWFWLPGVGGYTPQLHDATAADLAQRQHPVAPGDNVPEDGTVMCEVSVATVPLAAPPDTAAPPAPPHLGPGKRFTGRI